MTARRRPPLPRTVPEHDDARQGATRPGRRSPDRRHRPRMTVSAPARPSRGHQCRRAPPGPRPRMPRRSRPADPGLITPAAKPVPDDEGLGPPPAVTVRATVAGHGRQEREGPVGTRPGPSSEPSVHKRIVMGSIARSTQLAGWSGSVGARSSRASQLASRMSTTNTSVSVARDRPVRRALRVALGGRHHEQDLRADRLADQALVPAGDDRAGADLEGGGRAALPRRVEDRAGVPEHARVVDRDGLARPRRRRRCPR